jgi:hypothetical protein
MPDFAAGFESRHKVMTGLPSGIYRIWSHSIRNKQGESLIWGLVCQHDKCGPDKLIAAQTASRI